MSTGTQTLSSQLSALSAKLTLYYLMPIYALGILGNLLNLMVFLRRNMRSNACAQYFISMSITELILFVGFFMIRMLPYITGYDLTQTVPGFCKIRVYFYVFTLGLIRQFLCLISIDRWVVTTRRAVIRKFSSPNIVRWLIAGNTLFWLLYSSHAAIGYQISPTRGCTFLFNADYASFYAQQSIVSSIIPFMVMVVFSILTLRNVHGFQRINANAQTSERVTGTALILIQNMNRHRHEMQLIKLSVLQVIVYILLNMTLTIYPLYSVLTNSQTKSADQMAIEAFLNTSNVFLFYTYNAVC